MSSNKLNSPFRVLLVCGVICASVYQFIICQHASIATIIAIAGIAQGLAGLLLFACFSFIRQHYTQESFAGIKVTRWYNVAVGSATILIVSSALYFFSVQDVMINKYSVLGFIGLITVINIIFYF